MQKIFIEIIGAVGLVGVLAAFFLLQRRKLTDDDHLYNILNIAGSICVAVYSSYYRAWFSVILNVVWLVVAAADLLKNLKKKTRSK